MAKKKTGYSFLGDDSFRNKEQRKKAATPKKGAAISYKTNKSSTPNNIQNKDNINKAVRQYSSANKGGSQFSVRNESNLEKQRKRNAELQKKREASVKKTTQDLMSKPVISGNSFLVRDKSNRKNKGQKFEKLTTGTAKQIAGGVLTSLGDDTNQYNETKKNLDNMLRNKRINKATYDANLRALERSNRKAARDKDWEKSEQHKAYQKIKEKGTSLNEAGNREVEEGMQGLTGAKKIAADAYTSGLGMAADAMLGPAWFAGMATRSYGNNLNSVKKLVEDGVITEKEGENYAGLQALKEIGTEAMFKGAGLASKLVGAGNITKKLDLMLNLGADKLTNHISNNALKNITSSALKLGLGATEEAAEELVGGLLDAPITNLAYANRLDKDFRSTLQNNSSDVKVQRDSLVKYGYSKEDATNVMLSTIGSEEFVSDLANGYAENGLSEKQAKKQAKLMSEYFTAEIKGDAKAKTLIENQMADGIKQKFSMPDTLEAMASAGLMTAVTGLGGAVNTNHVGNNIKKYYAQKNGSDNAASAITKLAKGLDDKTMAARASAMYEYAEKGKDLSNEQYFELQKAIDTQLNSNHNNTINAYNTGKSIAQAEKYIEAAQASKTSDGKIVFGKPIQRIDANGNARVEFVEGGVTNKKAINMRSDLYELAKQHEQAFGKIEDKEALIEEIVAIENGFINPETVEYFTDAFPENRSLYETFTGVTLPKNNAKMRDFLFKRSADNYVKTAKNETIEKIDADKGQYDVALANTFGGEGQHTLQALTNNIGIADGGTYVAYTNVLGKAYDAGSKGTSFDSVKSLAKVYAIDVADVKAMYDAGVADGKKAVPTATVRYDVADPRRIKNSERDTLLAFAKAFGRNIVVTDSLTVEKAQKIAENKSIENTEDKGPQVNGMFVNSTNTIYVNLSENVDTPIGYTIMHELTHSIKVQSASEYELFANLYKRRWIEKNGKESFDKAIADKIKLYEDNGASFTNGKEEAEALEEIICDQMGEILHDEEFLENVADEHPDLARAILSAVRNVLRKIRELFAEYGGFPSKYNNAMLSQLDLLKEAESLLCKAVNTAQVAQNEMILRGRNVAENLGERYDAVFSLENKNITKNSDILYIIPEEYIDVPSGDKGALRSLQKKVKNLPRSTYENEATGYKANIISETINKALYPTDKTFNKYNSGYIRNLNAILLLPELFKTAVYVDTVENQKEKNEGKKINGFHHFVAPVILNGERSRALITARDKEDSDTIYILNVEVFPTKKEMSHEGPEKIEPLFKETSPSIKVPDLVEGVKIYNYKDRTAKFYTIDDIKFDMSKEIEKARDLIAVHNIEEKNLIKILDLGGLPMPSIAITKAELGHTNFGKISVLFSRDAIDPSVDGNKVYGADAWTPTFPTIYYEINTKKAEKIYRRANAVGSRAFFYPAKLMPLNLEDKLNLVGGQEGLVGEYINDYGLKQMYLVESGKPSVEIEKKTINKEMSEDAVKTAKWYLENENELVEQRKKLKKKITEENNGRKQAQLSMQWKRDNLEKIGAAYSNYLTNCLDYDDEAKKKAISAPLFEKVLGIDYAVDFLETGGIRTKEVDDEEAAKTKIDELVKQEDYENWLKDLFSGIEAGSGVWNGKEVYTASGNRRSFKQLHYPVTVDNIVNAMIAQSKSDRNADARFVGIKTIRGAAVKEFTSIEDIKASAHKLNNTDTEEYKELKKSLDERLAAVMNRILGKNYRGNNSFLALDSLGRAIEAACSDPTEENIKKTLGKYSWKTTIDQVKEIQAIINEVVDMPVNMFEAKPKRVVGFDEIKAVVLPENSSRELIDRLNDKNINYIEYDGTTEDRLEKVNSVADDMAIKFSFAGVKARTGGKTPLRFAEEMELDGKSSEEIRQRTGWFKAADGKWRFEIDDSKMRLRDYFKELASDSEKRFNELELKMILGTISETELNELKDLNKKYGKGNSGPTYLSDYIEHDELFKAYPELENILVEPAIFERRTLGSYTPELQRIAINDLLLKKNPEKAKAVFAHEIQHAIQIIEGFDTGGSPDGVGYEGYYNLSGEIEARETEKRINLTAEEREKIRPDIDSEISYEKRDEYDERRGSNQKHLREVISSEDENIKFSMDNDLYDPFLDGDISDEAKSRRVKIRAGILAEIENISRSETKLSHEIFIDEKAIKPKIKELLDKITANSDVLPKEKRELLDYVMGEVETLWQIMKTTNGLKTVTPDEKVEVRDYLLEIAHNVIGNINYIDSTVLREYKLMREYFKTTKIRVRDNIKSDIDWDYFRRKNFGRMILVGENYTGVAVDVDEIWDEVVPYISSFANTDYDSLYDIENLADMLLAIDSALDNTQAYRDLYASEVAQDLEQRFAVDLLGCVAAKGKPWESFADKKKKQYDERTRQLKQRHKEVIREMRLKNKEKLAEEKVKTKEALKKKVDAEKQRGEKKLQSEKDKQKARKEKEKTLKERLRSWGHIEENYNWLQRRLLNPKKEEGQNIPEELRVPLAKALEIFDLQTERSAKLEESREYASKATQTLRQLRDEISKVADEDGGKDFVVHPVFFSTVDKLIESMGNRPLRELTNTELSEIDDMLSMIRHMIAYQHKMFTKGRQEAVESAGEQVIEDMDEKVRKYGRGYSYTGVKGTLRHLFNEDMMTPADFFDSLGGQMKSMYRNLRYAQDEYITKIKALSDFCQDTFQKYFNDKKPGSLLDEWTTDKNAKTFTLTNGESVTLSVAQMMSLYCMSKREQALSHILGSGIVLSEIAPSKKVDEILGTKEENTVAAVRVTYGDVLNIISELTEEQRQLADALQGQMNGMLKDWGNETSMQLYGIRLFKEENYFPINVEDAYLDGKIGEASGISGNKITSFGFTKPITQFASNPIIIGDIFDIFSDHANKMALFSSYSAALLDFNRVYNYKHRDVETGLLGASVKQKIEDAFGKRSISFITNLLNDINGQAITRTDGVSQVINSALARYKKASIGINLRVLVQQPTAIVRSLYYLNPKYFTPSCFTNLFKAKDEMHEHCPIAYWKANGNYQNDYTRGLKDQMFNRWSKFDAVTMGVYGFADDITWTVIWNAIKNEVQEKHPSVIKGSDEFWILCNERATEVFDKTQVVDSVFHRSDAMRSTNGITKTATSFMAEPTRTYNMIRSSVVKARRMAQEGDKASAQDELSKITAVIVLNAAAVSVAAALVDALRGKGDEDDDETFYETWLRNFWENFKENVYLLNQVVFIKDITQLFANAWDGKNYGTSNMALEGWYKLAKGVAGVKDVFSGEKGFVEWATGDFAAGLGYVTGIPVFNLQRDIKSIWEKLSLPTLASEEGNEAKKISLYDYEKNPLKIEDGTWCDKVLNTFGINLTAEERADRAYKKSLKEIKKKTKGLSGDERAERVNELVMDGYTKTIAKGDTAELERMRKLIKGAGGNVEEFDEKVSKKIATAYKKTIGKESKESIKTQARMKEYLLSHGWTEAMISRKIVYYSDAGRDYKAAAREMNYEAMVNALVPLIQADLTEGDCYKLYMNRNRGGYDTSSSGVLTMPVAGEISSSFGYRSSPTAGASSYHEGIDIAASLGATIGAADGGEVVFAGYNGSYGNQVVIRHDNGSLTYYSHLDYISVKKGQNVSKKQYVGNVGSTGVSTGPHLDFRVSVNGSFVNPMDYFG